MPTYKLNVDENVYGYYIVKAKSKAAAEEMYYEGFLSTDELVHKGGECNIHSIEIVK